MLTQRRSLFTVVLASALLCSAYQARATSVEFFAPSETADPSVKIVLTEDEGDILVSLSTDDDVSLRKFTLNISDNSLFAGLRVTGDDVSSYSVQVREPKHDSDWDWKKRRDWDKDDWHKDRGKKHGDRGWDKGWAWDWDKGKGKDKDWPKHGDWDKRDWDKHHDWDKKHRGKESDLEVLLGTQCCKEGLFETTFVLDAVADLALSDFIDERIGVSVVGFEKDECDPTVITTVSTTVPDPIPEPASALLLGLGLSALALTRRSRSET
jgi:hypothetical protein